jgi:hypothetical protein
MNYRGKLADIDDGKMTEYSGQQEGARSMHWYFLFL